jgi:hypothetical protein
MGFWGGSSDSADSGGGEANYSSDYGTHEESSYPTGVSSGGGGGGNGMQEMQQASMAIQQQMLVQQVISDLSDRSYEKCITAKPTESLTGTQVACIRSTTNKWLDTNEFMTGRLAKKSQQQQQSGGYN